MLRNSGLLFFKDNNQATQRIALHLLAWDQALAPGFKQNLNNAHLGLRVQKDESSGVSEARYKIMLEKFLLCVAHGEQDKAEALLKNAQTADSRKPGDWIFGVSTFTDYAGRTFTCSAYEYARWTKDKHMCDFLEKYMMDDEAKTKARACIEEISKNGLYYMQHGRQISGSPHFDINPLKRAYVKYLFTRSAWKAANCPKDGEAAVRAALLEVGVAQRDLPVHYVREFLRTDSSFDPLPDFNDQQLPLHLIFVNYRKLREELLFPLVDTDSTGLGISFVLMKGVRSGGDGWAPDPHSSVAEQAAILDLAAMSKLDEVRTDDMDRMYEQLILLEDKSDVSHTGACT